MEVFGLENFQEVVSQVRDLEASISTFESVAGWEVIHRGPVPGSVLQLWGMKSAAGAREALLRNPGATRGELRLVEIPGATGLTRPAAPSWDTGGIFDFNVRVLDVHGKLEELRRHGWDGMTAPVEFSFGPFVVREVLARDSNGIVVAMIERVQPTLEGWPYLKHFSRIFNSTQTVRDFDRSLEFFRDHLGFQIYLEHEGTSSSEGPNVLGLPHNLTDEIPRRVVILSPDGKNDGSVELISFDGATGEDHSATALPGRLGMTVLRFPVADLDGYRDHLVSRGLEPTVPTAVELPPHGRRRVFTLRAPEGAWLEFFETASKMD